MELFGQEELKQVMEVMEGGFHFRYGVSVGDEVDPRFKAKVFQAEKDFARACQVPYAIAVNSGTASLLTAFAGLGVGPGDEVIVPGYTFIASISTIVFSRAIPILAEEDRTLNMDPKDLEAKITPRTKAICVVHMMGNPARMDELKAVADKHGIPILEDCAQAFGASYKGKPVGSMGKIGAFSLNAYKMITCGEGGMITTHDEDLYKRCFAFHDQGHVPHRTGVEIGKRPFIGLNFRMTELQGALVIAQIPKTKLILEHLRRNKKRYKELVADLPGIEFREVTDPDGECATIVSIFLPTAEIAQKIATDLKSKVLAQAGWHVYNNMEQLLEQRTITPEACPFTCPYYTSKAPRVSYRKGMLPQTDDLLNRTFNIGIGLTDPNLSSAFGMTIHDGLDVVEQKAALFRKVAEKYLK